MNHTEDIKIADERSISHDDGKPRSWSPEAERKLVRKIDFRILPMLIIMYILNYVDRTK
jgi:hypothetical protein